MEEEAEPGVGKARRGGGGKAWGGEGLIPSLC